MGGADSHVRIAVIYVSLIHISEFHSHSCVRDSFMHVRRIHMRETH